MSYSCDEAYEVYDETFPKARKAHRCHACRRTIEPGHVYARIFMVWDGTCQRIIRCLCCQEIHEHLRTLGDSETWPSERLDCGELYEDHWGCEPPEDIQRLVFMTPDEVQAEFAGERPRPLRRTRLTKAQLAELTGVARLDS